MKRTVTYKPLTHEQYKIVKGKKALTDLILNTGARITEIKRIIDVWEEGMDYVDIKTKKSGSHTNRIYLSNDAQYNLSHLKAFKNNSVRTLQRVVQNVSEAVEIPFSSHNLRATFATRLMEIGVDLVTVQHLLNHSDISTTALYIQFNEIKLRSSLELLNDYETIEGYTLPEAIKEIAKLRTKLKRLEVKTHA